MSIDRAIYTRLVTNEVGNALYPIVGTNVYPTIAPELQDPPFVSYHRVQQATDRDLCAKSNTRQLTIDFYGWATTPLAALQIADAIIDRFVMVAWQDVTAGVYVDGSRLDNVVAFYENESRLHRTATSIMFRYRIS